MKNNTIFVLATGAFLLVMWNDYIDPLLELVFTHIKNKQILSAVRLQTKVDVYNPDGNMGESEIE